MITSADLTPDKEFTDKEGDVRRIVSIVNGRVDYRYFENGKTPGIPQSIPIWQFLQCVNERADFFNPK